MDRYSTYEYPIGNRGQGGEGYPIVQCGMPVVVVGDVERLFPTIYLSQSHSPQKSKNEQKNAMVSIPVDILRNILEHVDTAGLLKMCLLNKICCSCSQDVLYRDIHSEDNRICRTLVKSSHLARRVRSFSLYAHGEELAKVLRNMTSLRTLTLSDRGSVSNLMDECTFKLESLSCFYDIDESLHKFLCSQPSLTTLAIYAIVMTVPVLEMTCLPNLTHLTAWFPRIPTFIRGRSVSDVTVIGAESMDYNFGDHDFDYSVLSAAPIRKLWISYEFLFPKPAPILASITPSLVHLSMSFPDHFIRSFETRVGPPLYLFE
jgi:hypothetical protein